MLALRYELVCNVAVCSGITQSTAIILIHSIDVAVDDESDGDNVIKTIMYI